jgi:two-component system sensor histidine kinase ChiS
MKKILIAEDEDILLKVLKDRLEEAGWHVTGVSNGKSAIDDLNKAGRDGYDLLLLDLLMPEMSGFEVLEEIKKNAELVDLPIIVLSNLGGDDDIKKAMKLGADDYFVKAQHPMSEIVEKVEKFAAGGHALNKRTGK